MTKQLDTIKKTRLFLLELVKDLSVEEVNQIPPGFNNNIAWNLAHLVAAQQGVCYVRASLKPAVDQKYIEAYKTGTKPEQIINDKELTVIKDLMLSSIDKLHTDYQNGIFSNYKPWTTRYGVELASIDDAIEFIEFHEGLHTGYITALKRLVKR